MDEAIGGQKQVKHEVIMEFLSSLEAQICSLEHLVDRVCGDAPPKPSDQKEPVLHISLSQFLTETPNAISLLTERVDKAVDRVGEYLF